jgi:hypothetical protein
MRAVAAKLAKNGNGQADDFEELSIQQIALRCGLDRATTKKRLDQHRYEPAINGKKLKIYRFDAEMEARLTESDTKLTDAKTRKETAAAQLAEIKVAKEIGELASVGEFIDVVQRLFGAMHKEIAVRMPKRLAARLAKAKNPAEISKILSADLNKTFNDLREDHSKFLGK